MFFRRLPPLPWAAFLWLALLTMLLRLERVAGDCLPDAIPEADRQSITLNSFTGPLGLFAMDWDSSKVLTAIFAILAREVIGMNSTVEEAPSAWSSDGLAEIMGCSWTPSITLDCPDGPISSSMHIFIEYWDSHPIVHHGESSHYSGGFVEISQLFSERAPELAGTLDYLGRETAFVRGAERSAYLASRGGYLEFHGSYNSTWHTPSAVFSVLTDIPTGFLKNCEDVAATRNSVINTTRQFITDPDGFDEEGNLRCDDGYWWLSPACRDQPTTCVPFLAGGRGQYVEEMVMRSVALGMPLAIASVGSWSYLQPLARGYQTLFFWYSPSPTFLDLEPLEIAFPPQDEVAFAAGDKRTSSPDIRLLKLTQNGFSSASEDVWKLLQQFSFGRQMLGELLLDLSSLSGDVETTACQWIQNHADIWTPWVPATEPTKCYSGAGVVNSTGDFVTLRSLATSCSTCPEGYYSSVLSDLVGDTMVCLACPAGTFQGTAGSTHCQECSERFMQGSVGASACERCAEGSYVSETGSTACTLCSGIKTTLGSGEIDKNRCFCPQGYYEAPVKGHCVPCETGAKCAGFGHEPQALFGFQLDDVTDEGLSLFHCHSDHRKCPGGDLGVCAEGREGRACGRCMVGMTSGEGGECKTCSSADTLPLIGVVFLVCMMLSGIYYMALKQDSAKQAHTVLLISTVFAQLVSVLQIMGVISRMSAEWTDPLLSLMRSLLVFSFDLKVLRIECWAPLSPLQQYVIRLCAIPFALVFLLIMHVNVSLLMHRKLTWAQLPTYVGSVGVLLQAFFTMITSSIETPFHCQQHPNGLYTMLEYEADLCWQGSAHLYMTIIAVAMTSAPIAIFSAITWLVYVFPARMSVGDVHFLNTYSFLFLRFKPACRWFVLVALGRNWMVSIVPSVPDGFWQLVLIMFIFDGCIALNLLHSPWRTQMGNVLDLLCMFSIHVIVRVSAFFLSESNIAAAEATIVFVFMSLLAFVVASVYFVMQHCSRRGQRYDFFLCHRKASAGAFARLLKVALPDSWVSSDAIFLDSDNLDDLNRLFEYVKEETKTLLVLCSHDVFFSRWCLGEVTCAVSSNVRILPLHFTDYSNPTPEFIAALDVHVDLRHLTENGYGLEDAKNALKIFVGLDFLRVPEELDLMTLTWLTRAIMENQARSIPLARVAARVSKTKAAGNYFSECTSVVMAGVDRAHSVIIVDSSNREAVAAALIFCKLLTPLLANDPGKIPRLIHPDTDLRSSDFRCVMPIGYCEVLLLFCTNGCFSNRSFLVGLLWAMQSSVPVVVPVQAAEDFEFPNDLFYNALQKAVGQLCQSVPGMDSEGLILTPFVVGIFKRIFQRFSANSNIDTLQVQTRLIWKHIVDQSSQSAQRAARSSSERPRKVSFTFNSAWKEDVNGGGDMGSNRPSVTSRLSTEEAPVAVRKNKRLQTPAALNRQQIVLETSVSDEGEDEEEEEEEEEDERRRAGRKRDDEEDEEDEDEDEEDDEEVEDDDVDEEDDIFDPVKTSPLSSRQCTPCNKTTMKSLQAMGALCSYQQSNSSCVSDNPNHVRAELGRIIISLDDL